MHLRCVTLLAIAAFALGIIPLMAQTPTAASAVPMPTGGFSQPPSAEPIAYAPTLTFDVASIREVQPAGDNPSWAIGLVSPPHSCQFQAKAHPVKVLLALAYGFTPFEISGAPDWINTSLYDVDAKCDHSVDQQFARFTDDQAKLEKEHMLQALLADRFHLKAHWESKQASVYALETRGSEVRLKASARQGRGRRPLHPQRTAPLKPQGRTSRITWTRTAT